MTWHYQRRGDTNHRTITADLSGMYQKENLATVLTSLHVLKNKGITIDDSSIKIGLKNVRTLTGLNGRWQILAYNPQVVCDIAHNKDGIQAIVEQLKMTAANKIHFVLGFVNDKDIDEILRILPTDASYYLCEPVIPRAMKLATMEAVFSAQKLQYQIFSDIQSAFFQAEKNAAANDHIYIDGSIFIVSYFLRWKKITNLFEFHKRHLYLHRFNPLKLW